MSDAAGASANRYQLILSGELRTGYDLSEALATLTTVFEAPESQLRQLFDGSSHRVQQALDAEEALELQSRLQAAGIECRVEKTSPLSVALTLRQGDAPAVVPDAVTEASLVRAAAQPRPAPEPSPIFTPRASEHAEKRWKDAWANSHVEDDPEDNDEHLAMFVGPSGLRYVDRFRRVSDEDGRPVLRPGWNWGTFVSPFLWALYRKMWGWSLVMAMTEVVVPLIMFSLARHGELAEGFATLAALSMVGNRLFWPLIADYLYYRHSQGALMQVLGLTPGYASDLDIATAGGVSRGAVLVGVALSSVLALFLWSLVASVHVPAETAYEPQAAELSDTRDSGVAEAKREENRWTATRRKLRELGQVVTSWMLTRPKETSLNQLNLFRLREDTKIDRSMLLDAWDMEMQFLPDNEGYRLVSAGPDKLFGTADDIMYRRILSQ